VEGGKVKATRSYIVRYVYIRGISLDP
jgi:hypothetical protein